MCADVSVEMIVGCLVRRILVVNAIQVIFTGTMKILKEMEGLLLKSLRLCIENESHKEMDSCRETAERVEVRSCALVFGFCKDLRV